jgi:uncharacterized protein YndB with AHSA1/START domain
MSTNNSTRPSAFVNTRVFNASREQLWEAFADPDQLVKWWGPAGFTNTIHEFSFEPGALWKYTMHAPDGTAYYNESELLEIVPGERIHVLHLRPMHRFHLTMTYDKVDEAQTRLTWVMVFDDEAEADRVRAFVPAANEQNLDRLEALLKSSY